MGLSRSWFYEQQQREQVDTDQPLVEKIDAVVQEFVGDWDRRVTHELARRGHHANHTRVLRSCENAVCCLLCRPKRRFRATTDSNHREQRFSNLLREVIVVRPDQVWQADLTSVRVQRGLVSLACVLDNFAREEVGGPYPGSWTRSCRWPP